MYGDQSNLFKGSKRICTLWEGLTRTIFTFERDLIPNGERNFSSSKRCVSSLISLSLLTMDR